jgi:hypothetical protein
MRTELPAEELVLYRFHRRSLARFARREYLMPARPAVGVPGIRFVRNRATRSRGELSEDDLKALESMAVALAPWARDSLTVGPEP